MYIIIRLSNLCSLLCCFRVAAYDFIIKKKCSVYTFFNLLTLPYSHPRAIYISWEDFSECLSCRAGFLDVSCYGRDMDNVPPYVNHFIIKSIYIYEKNPTGVGPFALFLPYPDSHLLFLFGCVHCAFLHLLPGYIAFSDLCLP